MIRTRIALAAAVVTLALGTVAVLPGAATAAQPEPISATVQSLPTPTATPGNGTWG
ncbi:hypothetical protein [Kitasatospora sp. NPDC002040]|uniref:hypothetical protein n=1 Tax=Kitasatospora sp. NPDC002040 TaxID=3154661 RepID=UPI00332CAD7B